jgi:hypothetical protein
MPVLYVQLMLIFFGSPMFLVSFALAPFVMAWCSVFAAAIILEFFAYEETGDKPNTAPKL